MNRSRKLTTVALLAVLGTGGLTACGSGSSDEPQSMSTTSVIDNGPTSGIRTEAASPKTGEEAGTQESTPRTEKESRQTEMASPASGPHEHESSADSSKDCGDDTARTAVAENLDSVPGVEDPSQWEVEDDTAYDACAGLSWITLTGGGTGSSPRQQMLFHPGDYLGTTTAEPIGFHPATTRLSDTSIRVTYTYVEGSESNAEARGRAVSTYTWNEATESIDHAGEWPPGID